MAAAAAAAASMQQQSLLSSSMQSHVCSQAATTMHDRLVHRKELQDKQIVKTMQQIAATAAPVDKPAHRQLLHTNPRCNMRSSVLCRKKLQRTLPPLLCGNR
jgi:3-oxoacyl-[acyl-carrier-protein] synthase III